MFYQSILLDNLLQLQLNIFNDINTFEGLTLSIFEYLFRIIFIGIFIPFYLFSNKTKITIIKFMTWFFMLFTGRTNILDKMFLNLFYIYPFQLISIFWLSMFLLSQLYNYNYQKQDNIIYDDSSESEHNSDIQSDIQSDNCEDDCQDETSENQLDNDDICYDETSENQLDNDDICYDETSENQLDNDQFENNSLTGDVCDLSNINTNYDASSEDNHTKND